MSRIALTLAATLLLCLPTLAGPLENELLASLRKGDEARAEKLLKRGANPNAQDRYGTSALMLAVQKSSGKMVDLLLAKGASVHLRDKEGFTVLSYGFPPTYADRLYKLGARPSPNDNGTLTDSLEGSIWSDSDALDEDVKAEVLQFIRGGGNLNHRGFDEHGSTPLGNAVESRPSIVRFLLDLGADPNCSTGEGETPLLNVLTLYGAMYDRALQDHVAKLLLDRGARVNVQDRYGFTPLLYTVHSNRYRLLQRLLKVGANVNVQDKQGQTALMICAHRGFVMAAKSLLEAGANPWLKDKNGRNALDIAEATEVVLTDIHFDLPSKTLSHEQEISRIVQGRALIARMLWERRVQPAKLFKPEVRQ